MMITSEFKDADGFELQFDEKCPESDKKYFIKQFPKVDGIAGKRVHCTTCDTHIGTAPISEKIVRTHLILAVTQCNKCFAFYNSGEFGKGEDGSEYYCRWCGQGGEVFCCSSCPYVFCNKCIRNNLSQSYEKEIEETDDWSCFVCNKEILKNHRANHWALRNFMNKQLEKIQKSDIHDEEEVNDLLNDDSTTCCPRKKRKPVHKPPPVPSRSNFKRQHSVSREYLTIQPPAKKPNITLQQKPPAAKAPTFVAKSSSRTSANSRSSQNNSEIVCTPDISGLFTDNEDSAIPTTNMMPSTSTAPPPLIMRDNQVRVVRPQNSFIPNPIYHNVNGYQIDLNHAARQEIFRLPNGKLIQVRKQTAPQPVPTPFRQGFSQPVPRQNLFSIRQANAMTTARMLRPTAPQTRATPAQTRMRQQISQPQQRFTFTEGRVVPTPASQPSPQTPPAPAAALISSIFTQQNGSISVARAPQPSTPFGTAKTEFEDRIIGGLEICQHTINKMITLTNASSFKQCRSFNDLKDLYIHLEYLFSYTADKFKTLQDNLKAGKESLEKHSVSSTEKHDKDELEIVEEKTDVIEVLSDDEDEAPVAPIVKPRPMPASAKRLWENIQKSALESTSSVLTQAVSSVESSTSTLTATEEDNTIQNILNTCEEVSNDRKLKNKVVVKAEKLEDSKDPIIKQMMRKMQERLEEQSEAGSSRGGSPNHLVDFELPMNVDAAEEEANANPEVVEVVDDKDEEIKSDEKALEESSADGASEAEPIADEKKDEDKKASEEEVATTEDVEIVDDEMKGIEKKSDDSESAGPKEISEGSDKGEVKDNSEIPSNSHEETETTEKKDIAEDIPSKAEEMSAAAESLFDSIKKADDMKIDCDLPTELMEVDDEDTRKVDSFIDLLEKSQDFMELTIETISSDEEEPEKPQEDSPKTDVKNELNSEDKTAREQAVDDMLGIFKEDKLENGTDETKPLAKNELEENGNYQLDDIKAIGNESTKSPSPLSGNLQNGIEHLSSDISTSEPIKLIDNLLITSPKENTQDLIEDDKLDDFFDDLEEHIL